MNLPKLPSPDDIESLLLHFILGQGIILTLVLFVKKLYDWYRTACDAFEKSRKAITAARSAGKRLRMLRFYGLIAVVVSTMAMLCGQAMWLVSNFLIGNIIYDAVNSALPDNRIPSWGQFVSTLHWNVASESYIVASMIALLVAYSGAFRFKEPLYVGGLSFIFSVPGMIYGFCGIVGGPLTFIAYLLTGTTYGMSKEWALFEFGVGIVGCLYVFTCYYVLLAPWNVRRIWSAGSTL